VEYRYRDKVYLSNYMLDTKLFDSFEFLVEDATPIRSVYILKTDQGMKILKKIDHDIKEVMFVYNSLNDIRKKYPYVINFKESIYGKPYVEYLDGIYAVYDIIEGRECVFENPIDLKMAATALAKFHRAGENIEIYCSDRNQLGKMIEKFNVKAKTMEKYKDIASMHFNKSDFDKIYLEYADYYINYAQNAARILEKSPYKELCMVKHTLCHHDLAHHNLLIGNDDNVHFIDFDYSVIDLSSHDISNIITKAIKHSGWDIDIADTVMEFYKQESEMAPREMEVLYGYLMFPQDFCEISTNYYMRTRNWDEDEFVDKLKRKAEYKIERERFLSSFEKKWVQG
jgi:CotS family spore coat protein